MKISTRRDIDVSPAMVFEALTDFDEFEQQARTHGAQVQRLDDGSEGKAQARWAVQFDFRGRSRKAEGRVVTFDPDSQLAFKAGLDGLDALFNIEIMQVAHNCARMFVSVDIRPKTMTGRLLVQSLKLAKSAMTRRLDKRLEKFATKLERDATV